MFEDDNKHATQMAGSLGLLQLKTAALNSTGREKGIRNIKAAKYFKKGKY
jgi:hypothetical protein